MSKIIYPEFIVRVKLPSSSGYHSSPSGDTEYESDYNKVISDATPPGFEVIKQRPNEKWAIDSEGRTCVPLRLIGEKEALAHYIEENKRLTDHINRIKKVVSS